MDVVVEAVELSRRFGPRWAYARLTFEVRRGERFLVVGANGSGKTTLLRTLATILQPSAGSLKIFGLDPRNLDELRPRVGILSHKAGLYDDLSAMDNLRFYGKIAGRPVPADLLERVGLDVRPEPVHTYSAGMRKRLGLAVLLLQQPELVLLDEPYGQLDPTGMDQMSALIKSLDATLVIASHQLDRASVLCDQALVLHQGLPYWQGPARQVEEAWRKTEERVR